MRETGSVVCVCACGSECVKVCVCDSMLECVLEICLRIWLSSQVRASELE
jgi:hypothetical protein